MNTYNYDFIFCDMYGNEYEEVHLKNETPKDFNKKINSLKMKYQLNESNMSIKWI